MREVVVFGASGYSGLELIRRLVRRSDVTIAGASSDRFAGQRVQDRLPQAPASLVLQSHKDVESQSRAGQVALLATPAPVSAELAPRLLSRGLKVVDLSGAFRLAATDYPTWYNFEHPATEWLDKAAYGLPELWPLPEGTELVANPGCYATAAILAAAPLLQDKLLEPETPLIMDGKSGTTGAGRSAKDALLFSEVSENLRPYRLKQHQHTPEIERALARLGDDTKVSFTAHLIPMQRGLLVSVYGRAREGVSIESILQAYTSRYQSGWTRWVDRPPETARVRDDNFAEIHATYDPRTATILAFAAIDNLVKGAAGQAEQNLDALLAQVSS